MCLKYILFDLCGSKEAYVFRARLGVHFLMHRLRTKNVAAPALRHGTYKQPRRVIGGAVCITMLIKLMDFQKFRHYTGDHAGSPLQIFSIIQSKPKSYPIRLSPVISSGLSSPIKSSSVGVKSASRPFFSFLLLSPIKISGTTFVV